ncbi:MAG: hypothetical protein JXB05_17910 [Myxococcaceae bacterium]|nr:hypothetical protein [Myxococcaceae bacterium]
MPKKPRAPYTQIIRNGSHAPGAPPASLEQLLALLETHPVAPWTTCHPLKKTPGATFFCGEFRTCRHPFSILSTEPAVVRRLTEAFLANCDRFQVRAEEPRTRKARELRAKPRRGARAR